LSFLIHRAHGRRAIQLPTATKIARLQRATAALYEIATAEFFDGSCAHNSVALWTAAREAGWVDVVVMDGSADPPSWTGEPGAEHVWLAVDGHVFDPTWSYHFDTTGTRYTGTPVVTEEDWAGLERTYCVALPDDEIRAVPALVAILRGVE